jgi:transcriptional regulator with XRE-family HTH domain
MLSDTLSAGLANYKIGPKIRALRLKKDLGLTQLAQHTGLSPAMLSKIERGRLFPTLPTLLRIALVFGVGLEHFFTEPADRPPCAVVRKKDRLRLASPPDAKVPAYVFESLNFPVTDRKMEGYYAEFPVQSRPSEPHRHKGAELIYVIKGQLVVQFEEAEAITLHDGDAMYFDSAVPHSYGRQGRSACAIIVIVTA